MKKKLDPKSVDVGKLFGKPPSPPPPPVLVVEEKAVDATTVPGTPLFAVAADPQWRMVTNNPEGLAIVRPVVLWEWRALEDGTEGWVGVTTVGSSLRLLSGNEIPGEVFQRYDIQWRS